MDEIKSPKSDVAKKQVILTETANVKIKEMIVESLKINKNKDVLAKEINSYINELAEEINDYPHLKTIFINGLKASTQRWFTYYSENIKFVTSLAIAQFSQAGIPVKDISISWSSADKFRPYVANNPKGLPIIENYQKKVKQQLTSLIHDNPTGVILDKDNKPRKVSLRNYAEREVRFEANKNDIESLKNKGVKLVITTTHADCSERCKPWQGQIFSLDGTSGVIDGKRYQPLENAMKGVNGDGNGIISGYNCRHRAIPYKSGMVLPTEYTEAEIKKQRAIDQEQRYRERTIRNLKVQERLLRANGDIELAKKVRLKWREKQTEYKVFSLENGRSYEEWRCRISNDEKDKIIDTNKEIYKSTNKELSLENFNKDLIVDSPATISSDVMKSLPKKYNDKIILMKERMQHIVERHPELIGKEKEIIKCATNPDYMIIDKGVDKKGNPRLDSYNSIKIDEQHSMVVSVKYNIVEDNMFTSIISARIEKTRRLMNKINRDSSDVIYKKDK